MRRVLAAIVLVLFAFLNVTDGICCPDGCTHDESAASQPQTQPVVSGACLLCLGGIESPVVSRPLQPRELVVDRPPRPSHTRYLDAPSDPLDHPPRLTC